MKSGTPVLLYTLLDGECYESLDRYQPSNELRDLVAAHLGEGWRIRPVGFWTHCSPESAKIRVQGWKIHISGTRDSCEELIRRLVPILRVRSMPFKFCSDKRMVTLANNKNWPRTGAGKFMTLYPEDTGQFLQVIDLCHQATSDLQGPYILTDRPYQQSRVVYYRYGEHAGAPYLNSEGRLMRAIVAPDGSRVSDERVPYFRLPPWVQDPFNSAAPVSSNGGEVWLKQKRYRVTGAEKYSSIGGIYTAVDTSTGAKVILREVRPCSGTANIATDPLQLLYKEARILKRLGPARVASHFVDLFEECGHTFLVEEKVVAESLWGYTTNFYLESCSKQPAELFRDVFRTIRALAVGVQTIHDHGIILRDLTKANVLLTHSGEPKFIDFEFAFELDGSAPPVPGWTEGYASPEQLRNRMPSREEDWYAFGALIIDMITFSAGGLRLNRSGVLAALRLMLDDFGLPPVLAEITEGLTSPDSGTRWSLDRAITALDRAEAPTAVRCIDLPPGSAPPARRPVSATVRTKIAETIAGIADYIRAKTDHRRPDRLWPASGELFMTNQTGIQFGAAGVVAFLHNVGEEIEATVIERIEQHATSRECPPGLYNGLAGIALVLSRCDYLRSAERVLAASSENRDMVRTTPGLYYGAAGWGLVNLEFWHTTGREQYRDNALEEAEYLVRAAQRDANGVYWDSSGVTPFGLGLGASGVALFLAYAHAVSPDRLLLQTAEDAMRFEMSQVQWVDHRPLWYMHRGAPASSPKSPHMRYGTAGVGTAALRLYALTGKPEYRVVADLCAYGVSTRFTNKLWQDYGLAGFGEFLLDMYAFLGDENYLNTAYYLAEGILPHAIRKPEGIVFAGAELLRISCDYGMGSAGIGMFLHRLLHPDCPRFMLPDDILIRRNAARAAAADVCDREPWRIAAAWPL